VICLLVYVDLLYDSELFLDVFVSEHVKEDVDIDTVELTRRTRLANSN
jgi:hypothetical protein